MAAGLMATAACQAPDADPAARPDAEAPQSLPQRPDGAHIILTQPLSLDEALDNIVQDAIFPPDADVAEHYHPGEEVIYITQGQMQLFQQGQDAVMLNAGDAYAIPAMMRHHAKAGPNGARAVIFRIHPRGEEIRISSDGAGN